MKEQEKQTKEQKNREELFKLMQENPELPILPMVDAEIIADDCGYWLGSWGKVRVEEYYLPELSEEIFLKSNDEEGCRPYYDRIPWKKAIVVYINAPGTED